DQIGYRFLPVNVSCRIALAPDRSYTQTFATVPSFTPTAIHFPSGEARGNSYAFGGSFNGWRPVRRSRRARSDRTVVVIGPWTYASEPVSETSKYAAGVDDAPANIGLRTPSTTGFSSPVASSRCRSNRLANSTPCRA